MIKFSIVFLVICCFSLHPVSAQKTDSTQHFTVSIYKNESRSVIVGYGYDIFKDGSLYIHQASIPAVAGIKGFSSRADAAKTAALQLTKLYQNIFPPSLSVNELDSLGILH